MKRQSLCHLPAIVVIGVAGSGKSTLAQTLAGTVGKPFVDGDDLHDGRAIEQMRRGRGLTEADRSPWLGRIALRLRRRDAPVLACSALRRRHRLRLRRACPGVVFLWPRISSEIAVQRLAERKGHFFPPHLIGDQFRCFDPPIRELDVVVLDGTSDPATVLQNAMRELVRRRGAQVRSAARHNRRSGAAPASRPAVAPPGRKSPTCSVRRPEPSKAGRGRETRARRWRHCRRDRGPA